MSTELFSDAQNDVPHVPDFGRIAYDAYREKMKTDEDAVTWEGLPERVQIAFRASAEAVIVGVDLPDPRKLNELYQFVILELKPLLIQLAENPMAMMTGGMAGMPQMPPPPIRSRK